MGIALTLQQYLDDKHIDYDLYALDAIVDDSLEGQPEIYLEGGDHRTLVHVHGDRFRALMKDAPHGAIAAHE